LTVVVLGGGAMGRITARDLAESAPAGTTVVVADGERQAACDVVDALPRRRPLAFVAARADASDAGDIAALLRRTRAFAVINATHHRFNLTVMDGALSAGAHYCDLGGLFHQTRRQLRQHAAWMRADRLALPGIGAAPGIVNVLARSAADTMESVREIHVAVGGVDRTVGRPGSPIGISYSIQTVLEEASRPAAVFTQGRLRFVPPMSDARDVVFPRPVGKQQPALTLHSEVATLPRTYRSKGLRECSFRIAFPRDVVGKLAFLREAGLLSHVPVRIGDALVTPYDVARAAMARLPAAPRWNGVPDEYEVLRVVVRGVRDGARVEETVDCHTPGIPAWRMGIDVDTGCPPSIAVQMLARGEITARGCVPPERAIPAAAFFRELRSRGMTVRRRIARWP
jgi:saccharopine dehydrogenase (NAD+, L-lysine-forming)